jgi:RES domain-containing protein
VISVSRLVKTRHAATAFDGEGARVFGGRWSSPGTAVVYAGESVAVAMLEILVHVQYPRILNSYSLIKAEFPDTLVEELAVLPMDWKQSPPPASTQAIGDRWARRRSAGCASRAPVVPRFNYRQSRPSDFAQVISARPFASTSLYGNLRA